MTQLSTETVKRHNHPYHGITQIHLDYSVLFVAAIAFTFLICNTVSAGPQMDNTATNAVFNLPVVKLNRTDSLTQTMGQINDAQIVLVGETHTRWDHHLVQLEVLKQLYQQSPKLALGVEWFQQPFQKHLDDYVAGKITEDEMLHLTDYFERWTYDYRLYRPIIQYAREQNIPIVALNASRELTNALSKSGFDDLPAELKAQLPGSYDWTDKAYENRLRSAFESHPDYPGKFEDFLRIQLTWDESMAERAAQYLQQNPQTRMLILAGSGHIAYGSGIPKRIKRRNDIEQFSILVSEDYLAVSEDIADFLVLSAEKSLEPVGLIGAYLETGDNKIVITGFTHHSAAKDAGVEKGAIITGVDDKKVESFAEFKLTMMDKKQGDTIELHYLDIVEDGSKNNKSVKLELR